jgi:hypothetical protein
VYRLVFRLPLGYNKNHIILLLNQPLGWFFYFDKCDTIFDTIVLNPKIMEIKKSPKADLQKKQ